MQRSHLSRETYERIVSALKLQKAGGLEKRSASRAGLRTRVTIMAWDGSSAGPVQEAWCRDLSPGGIGLLIRRPLKTRQQFLLRLPGQEDPLFLVYSVTRITQSGDSLYNVGATLRGPWAGNEADLKLVQSKAQAAPVQKPRTEIDRIRSAILD